MTGRVPSVRASCRCCARGFNSAVAAQEEVIVVSAHSILVIGVNGALRLEKRLEYEPVSAAIIPVSDVADHLLVASYQCSLHIYNDTSLLWAARTVTVPVCIRLVTCNGIRGLIAALSDDATLQLTYMGTDPPMSASQGGGDVSESDYASMDAEHKRLSKLIKQSNNDGGIIAEFKERVTLSVSLPPTLLVSEDAMDEQRSREGGVTCVRDEHGRYVHTTVSVLISHTFPLAVNDIHIAVDIPHAFFTTKRAFIIPTLTAEKSHTLTFDVFATTLLPSTLNASIVAVYQSADGESRIARADFLLPLAICARLIPPIKNCQYMFTLDTNQTPPNMSELFADLFDNQTASEEARRNGESVVSVAYWANSADVTVLVSKKTRRYRVQSGMFDSLALVSCELVRRLKQWFAQHKSDGALRIGFNELLPLADFFALIDRHWQDRQLIVSIKVALARYAHQFRVVQKRLIARYRERNPAELNALDVMLMETFQRISQRSSELSGAFQALTTSSQSLSSATQLILLLLTCKHQLDELNVTSLHQIFMSAMDMAEIGDATTADTNSAPVEMTATSAVDASAAVVPHDTTGVGWEECIDSALVFALKTVFTKSGRDVMSGLVGTVEPLSDVNKLKKHIQMLTDRLEKGVRITSAASADKARSNDSEHKASTDRR